MPKFPFSSIVLAAFALSACSPTYNWRDYTSPDAPYRVLFPAKPASFTRPVDLGNMKVDMTMTAAEVENTIFAVGTAKVPDPQQAPAALEAMEAAMVKNINGAVTSKKYASTAVASGNTTTQSTSVELDANGNVNGAPMRLIGHFEARDKRVYQVIVMGKTKSVNQEQAEQFLSSFKLL